MSTMVFIDGTNLLTEMAKKYSLGFRPDQPPENILNFAAEVVRRIFYFEPFKPLRYYWFGSYTGSDETRDNITDALRQMHFDAVLFKRREAREKGVDIALTKEMLVHAFQKNCARLVLVAGDEDYVGLVNEVKRYGPKVEGAFFSGPSFSMHLHRVLDGVHTLDEMVNACDESLRNCQSQFPIKAASAPQKCPTCGNMVKVKITMPGQS